MAPPKAKRARLEQEPEPEPVRTQSRPAARLAAASLPLGARLAAAEASSDEEEEEAEEDEEEEDPAVERRREALRALPLGSLARMQEAAAADGRAGVIARPPRYRGSEEARLRRENKNRPVSQSSRRPVPRGSHVAPLPTSRALGHDPRFEPVLETGGTAPSAAELQQVARKRYSFLFDERLPEERRRLKAAAGREKKEGRKEELRAALGVAEAALRREAAQRRAEKAAGERRQREKEAVAGGKKPFYLKKSAAKREELVAKFEELKRSGGLDKFLAKRRKKLAQKDHVHVPQGRGEAGRG